MSTHTTHVVYDPSARYPWKPVCSCGESFWGYAAEHAAAAIANDHASSTEPRRLYNYRDEDFRLADDVLCTLGRNPGARVIYRGTPVPVTYVRECANGTVEVRVRVGSRRPTIWLKPGEWVEAVAS